MNYLKPFKQIKRKAFKKAFIPGMYFYCERLPHKSMKMGKFYRNPYNLRDIYHPMKYIFKILDKNSYEMIYVKTNSRVDGKAAKWQKIEDNYYVTEMSGAYPYILNNNKHYTLKNYMLWSDFCNNRLINFIIMTQQEFIEKYFVDILLDA